MIQKLAIDSAPGKDLLKEIANGSVDAFKEFYELRKLWCGGYPLIHDGLVTYGFVDDLRLAWDAKVSFVPTMADIALAEDPVFFHGALFLLSALIPDDRILPRPAGFGDKLPLLKKKAEQFSFMPNMSSTWASLVTKARCLKPSCPDPSYLPVRELLIQDDAFLSFYPMPFPDLGIDAATLCPIEMNEIESEGDKTCHAGVDCSFESTAAIGQSKWWIFRCYPKAPGFIWIGYVYVRIAENGSVSIGHWTQHGTPISPEGLHRKLLNLEFSSNH